MVQETWAVPIGFLEHERRQFRPLRPAGSTQACGSEVLAFGPAFVAWLKPGPSERCHSTVFARCLIRFSTV
jgi:hypothetical protein